MKIEYGIAKTYEDLINNTTSELVWIDGKKVEEAELVIAEEKRQNIYIREKMSIIIKIVAILLVIFLMVNVIKYVLDIAKGK